MRCVDCLDPSRGCVGIRRRVWNRGCRDDTGKLLDFPTERTLANLFDDP